MYIETQDLPIILCTNPTMSARYDCKMPPNAALMPIIMTIRQRDLASTSLFTVQTEFMYIT